MSCRLTFSGFFLSLLLAITAVLSGCGGGGASPGTSTGGTGGTGGTTTATPTITLALTDPVTSAVRTSVDTSSPATLTATVRNAKGTVVPNAVVTFVTTPSNGSFTPASGTALTNSSGVATVTLKSGDTQGAATVTATSQLSADQNGGTAASATQTLNYASGGNAGITLSALTFGANPLSAYGTTSVSVTVTGTTSPLSVTFTSGCAGATSPKAFLTSTVTTIGGVATASYRDNACAGTDTVTAAVLGLSVSSNLTVTAPSAGSIQFVSALPTTIALKGTGGAGRQEFATVKFKVVDTGGNPIGNKTVNFGLSTSVGGIVFASSGTTTATAISDATTGEVVAIVNAGTQSTPVRVSATIAGSTLSTQSDQLVISTGIPAQSGFSVSASVHNMEGWSVDGTASTITARLTDHFSNPVPDGTAVSFVAEGGAIVPSCNTAGGVCSVTMTSQNTRPTNGRVTVLAYAIGEEAFTDSIIGNGLADLGEAFDANGRSTDLGEAYLDSNENGVKDATESYVDFNGDGAYTVPDGKYNGVSCDKALYPLGGVFCSSQQTLHVGNFGTNPPTVIVFSSSEATITINGGFGISLPPCGGAPGAPLTFGVTVVDVNGNAMPAGTTVAFSTDNGTITSSTPFIVPDTAGCRSGYSGCPASAASATFGDILVTMKSDATFTAAVVGPPAVPAACTNTNANGTFTVKVTSPRGLVTTASMPVSD